MIILVPNNIYNKKKPMSHLLMQNLLNADSEHDAAKSALVFASKELDVAYRNINNFALLQNLLNAEKKHDDAKIALLTTSNKLDAAYKEVNRFKQLTSKTVESSKSEAFEVEPLGLIIY